MEEINAYIKNIAVFTVAMNFAHIIMPDGFSKRYVNFVLGIILAITAMGPVIRIFDREFDADRIISSVEKRLLEEDVNEYSNYLFESIFEENLSADMERELKKAGITFESISADVKEDEYGSYVLESVKIISDEDDFAKAADIITERYSPEKVIAD